MKCFCRLYKLEMHKRFSVCNQVKEVAMLLNKLFKQTMKFKVLLVHSLNIFFGGDNLNAKLLIYFHYFDYYSN